MSWLVYLWFTHTEPNQLDLRCNVLTNLWLREQTTTFFPPSISYFAAKPERGRENPVL